MIKKKKETFVMEGNKISSGKLSKEISIDEVYNKIRNGFVKDKIENIRKEKDKKVRSAMKRDLSFFVLASLRVRSAAISVRDVPRIMSIGPNGEAIFAIKQPIATPHTASGNRKGRTVRASATLTCIGI